MSKTNHTKSITGKPDKCQYVKVTAGHKRQIYKYKQDYLFVSVNDV